MEISARYGTENEKNGKNLATGDLVSLEAGRDDGADVDADPAVDVHAVEEAVAGLGLQLHDPLPVGHVDDDETRREKDFDQSGHFRILFRNSNLE